VPDIPVDLKSGVARPGGEPEDVVEDIPARSCLNPPFLVMQGAEDQPPRAARRPAQAERAGGQCPTDHTNLLAQRKGRMPLVALLGAVG